MRTVITYGTFDLFHIGHLNLLERLAALGDKLIVGVSTDEFNLIKGKKKFKLNIPVSEQYETLGGFIISLNEKIPENDDKIFYNNLMFKIINVSSSKIEIVELIIED